MPLKPLQYRGPFGNQQSGEDAMSNWGNPQVTLDYAPEHASFRMPIPRWAPGEFAEWKQAKITGMPTTYGATKQMEYKSSKTPGLADMIRNGAGNANRLMSTLYQPAIEALKGIR